MPVTVRQMLKDKKLQGIVSVAPGVTVFQALTLMKEYNIGIVAVMRGSCILGLFSHQDNSNRVTLKHLDPMRTNVEVVMTPFSEINWIGMEADINDCLGVMDALGVNHLPVMEGEGEYARPIGMISNKDIERELVARNLLKEMEEDGIRSNTR